VITTIQDWLEIERRPADIYELLGRRRFDPYRRQLLAHAESAYRELQPYQNCPEGQVARRAVQLQREVARAAHLLADSQKLREHHQMILDRLRSEYVRARGECATDWSPGRLRAWLEQQEVHPQRLEAVAGVLAAPEDEAVGQSFHRTQSIEPPEEESQTPGYVLEERQKPLGLEAVTAAPRSGRPGQVRVPGRKGIAGKPPALPPRRTAQADSPLPLAQVVRVDVDSRAEQVADTGAGRRRQRLRDPAAKPAARPRKSPRTGRGRIDSRRRLLLLLFGLAGVICLAGLLLAWLAAGTRVETWRGQLLEVKGHDGEIHLLVKLDAAAEDAGSACLEAFTHDYSFAREIGDYRTAEDQRIAREQDLAAAVLVGPAAGDQVIVEGRRADDQPVTFRLEQRPGVPLIELAAVERVDERESRAVVGSRRDVGTFAPDRQRYALAKLIRIHPRAGEVVALHARYGRYEDQGAELWPSQSDRRRVRVEFPGITADAFAAYRAGDAVFAEVTISPRASPWRLVLRGHSIRRLQEPNCPITLDSGGGT